MRERLARSLERYAVATAAPATDRGFRSIWTGVDGVEMHARMSASPGGHGWPRIDEKLPTIAVPALVIRGGIEPIVPARWADEAARLLPRGQVATLSGSPHNSVYVAAAALTAAVEAFLDRVLPKQDGR